MKIAPALVAITLLLTPFTVVQASVTAVKPSPSGAEFKTDDGLLQIEFVTDRIAAFAPRRTRSSPRRPASCASP